MLEFSLVIPCRNEGKFIKEILGLADANLRKLFKDYRIIVIDASSRDDTVGIAGRMARGNRHIEVVANRPPYGKGADVRYGLLMRDAKICGFIDADIAPCIRHLPAALRQFKNGYGVVIGSRYTEGSLVKRPAMRLHVSRFYNTLMNVLFGERISDHQCGFKFFDRKAIGLMRKYSREDTGAFDSEVLLLAKYGGVRVYELPIEWRERRKFDAVRDFKKTLADIFLFFIFITRMFVTYRIMGFRPE